MDRPRIVQNLLSGEEVMPGAVYSFLEEQHGGRDIWDELREEDKAAEAATESTISSIQELGRLSIGEL